MNYMFIQPKLSTFALQFKLQCIVINFSFFIWT